MSEFIEKGFNLWKSRQTDKTPQDKHQTSVTDVVHVIIVLICQRYDWRTSPGI